MSPDPEECPRTIENWVTHAKNGYYNGVIFLICGSYVPVLQYGFHDAPVSRFAYTAALSLLGAAVFFLVRLEFFHAWRRLRHTRRRRTPCRRTARLPSSRKPPRRQT